MRSRSNEIWKVIPNYPDYMVSNFARLKSIKSKKARLLRSGYRNDLRPSFNLYNDGGKKLWKLSVLVAMAFLGHIPGIGKVVDHIDNDPLNNYLSNLQVITHRANISKDIKKNASSRFTGVYFNKNSGKWRARIHVNNKRISLGVYNTEIKAHLKYQKALKQLEYAE